jgi:hypothetical protein
LNDETLQNQQILPEKNKIFEVTSKYFNHQTNTYDNQDQFRLFFSDDLSGLCVVIDDKMKYSELTKEVMHNFFYFALKTNMKKMCFLLNRKNKDFVKILQGVMTVGFKTSNSRINLENIEYKVMTMEISKKFDEVQEIDF